MVDRVADHGVVNTSLMGMNVHEQEKKGQLQSGGNSFQVALKAHSSSDGMAFFSQATELLAEKEAFSGNPGQSVRREDISGEQGNDVGGQKLSMVKASSTSAIDHLPKLSMSDLCQGDILFMQDSTSRMTHFSISAAQFISNPFHIKSSGMTHVMLYAGDGKILEASGAGYIRESELKDEHHLKFRVLRLKDSDIAQESVNQGKLSVGKREQDKNYGNYSLRGTGGLLRSSTFSHKAERDLNKLVNDEQFYKTHCSGFVGGLLQKAEYQLNGELDTMKIHTKHTSPKKLYEHLRHSKDVELVGVIHIK
ncbi:C40 family peptidase [Vibrio mangrovi]|uniref:Uncharacterized protein n=1 Tax=Vibrio mangrovi TaxID=474394 RepID=A0A1Y6IQQ0_9VIBR|nr:hypothetical protein [Vibrio mangrovi]MDW6003233.1 hypothetical protein [Vibrio mangrovi]SMR99979.1 hypothetical protein VIM7927_01217 [Vibrio mangrovi]